MNGVLAALGLVICTPIMILLAIAIRIETVGPPLFSQIRVGKDQKPFTLVKLRTMVVGTPDAATHEVSLQQVTKLGRLLRKTRLDEMPQLWNVLIGDMDFVGPRPCLPIQHELVSVRAREGVFSVRPGITGLGQICGVDMSDPERLVSFDRRYVRSVSLRGDLDILMRTALGSWMRKFELRKDKSF